MRQFWNWVTNETGERELRLEGAIASESWLDDEVTPALFRNELMSGNGPVTIWVNSPGGDCVAAAQIYNMLMDYPGDVTVKIDGIAASAASVIAMAGTRVCMSPLSLLMIHNPLTVAMGDSEEMRKAIALLDEVKESIINAYEIKTGLSRTKISHMMDGETWMSAQKAKELGFCDEILYEKDDAEPASESFAFSRKAVTNCLLGKLAAKLPKPACVTESVTTCADTLEVPAEEVKPAEESQPEAEPRVDAALLEQRLRLLTH